MPHAAPAAVVFDFDGVLANSEPLHLRAFQSVLAEQGVNVGRDEYYARYLGFDDVGAMRAAGVAHGRAWSDPEIAALVARKTAVFDALLEHANVLFPEARACIERLAGTFPLGIASGALRHEIEAILRRAGLEHHFRFIVAARDTPSSKPAPDPYRRAAELHGLPPHRCVAIEDSRWGIESAKGAGLRCVGITTSYAAADLPGADIVIASLAEFTAPLIGALAGGTRTDATIAP
jgi:beta-phosphoglucomutase